MDFAIDIYSQRQIVGQEEAIRQVRLAGFSFINYDIVGIEDEADFISSPSDYGKKVRKLFDENNLKCALAHAPYFMQYGQEFNESERQYMEIVRAFECACELGCDTLVVHSISVPEGEDFSEYNLRFYRSLIPYAKKHNIKIAIENLYITKDGLVVGGKLETPEKMLSFLNELPPEHFTTCLDLGHALLTGYDPGEFILGLGDKLGHIHLHDNRGIKDDHTVPGMGIINWEKVSDALKKVGYSGVLSFELCTYLKDIKADELVFAMASALETGRKKLC